MLKKSIRYSLAGGFAIAMCMSVSDLRAQDYRMLQPLDSTSTRTETPDDYFQPQREPRGYQGNRGYQGSNTPPQTHSPSADSSQLVPGGMFDPQVRAASYQEGAFQSANANSDNSSHQPVMWDSQTASSQAGQDFESEIPWARNHNSAAACPTCGVAGCSNTQCDQNGAEPANSIIRSTTFSGTPAPDRGAFGAQRLVPVPETRSGGTFETPGVRTASWESSVQEQRDDNVRQTGGFTATQPESNAAGTTAFSSMPTAPESVSATAEAFEPGRVLARVGGEPIFIGDMMFEINQLIETGMPGAPDHIRKQLRPQFVKRLLPKYIDEKVLYVSVIDSLPAEADLDAILEQAEQEFTDNAMPKMMEQMDVRTPAEFDGQLRLMGSSLRRLRRSWAIEQFTRYFLLQELKIDSEVTHQEMLDFYHEHAEEYEFKARSRWEQVMVQFSQFPTRSAAREALIEMGNRIVYGADLAAVARESSHGFMAADGGQHDWTSRGSLVHEEIDEAIFALPVGELSDIIETSEGYHIVRVIEREEAGRTPFLEAQVEIREQIDAVKREQAFQDHIQKLKEVIPVEIYEDELEKLIEGENFTITQPG